jgi:GTP-binding protein
VGFSLFNLQERGKMMVDPGTEVYEGMIVGMHNRANDLVVNPLKGKQLTNVRASGTDENIVLTPPMKATLEQALTLIAEDELVEITPLHIRLRKRHLLEQDRKKASRGLKKA